MKLSLATTILSVALQNLSRLLVGADDPHAVNENSASENSANDAIFYPNLDRKRIVAEMRKPGFLRDLAMNAQRRRRVSFGRRGRQLANGRGVNDEQIPSKLDLRTDDADIQDENPDVGVISIKDSGNVDTGIIRRYSRRRTQDGEGMEEGGDMTMEEDMMGDEDMKQEGGDMSTVQERDCGWYPADVCQYCTDCDEYGNYCLDFDDEKCLGSLLDMCSPERIPSEVANVKAYFGAYFDYVGCPSSAFDDGYVASLGYAYCEYFQCVADGGECDDIFMDTVCEEMVDVCKEEHTFSCFWTQTPEDDPPCVEVAKECEWEVEGEEEGEGDPSASSHMARKAALTTVAVVAGGNWLI